jgi:hypothetical protein
MIGAWRSYETVSGGLVRVVAGLGAVLPESPRLPGNVDGRGSGNRCGGPATVRRRDLYPISLDKPALITDWKKVRHLAIAVGVGLLFWAAVYELVKW